MKKKTVMAFGSFDGLHDGHHFFISEIKKIGDRIIVVIPPDKIIEQIKKRLPRFKLEERVSVFKTKYPEIKIVVGDNKLGKWSAIKKFKPSIVALGYDQHSLKEALENSGIKPMPKIMVIDSHKPDIFKSSLI